MTLNDYFKDNYCTINGYSQVIHAVRCIFAPAWE